MESSKHFNPIATSRNIEKSYRDYLASTIHFADKELQSQLEGILGRENYLAKGPFLEATPPYEKDLTLRQLVDEGVLNPRMLDLGGFDPDRQLYVHQVRAIRRAHEGKNYIVSTGTGSGKTECFLLPIINDIMEEFDHTGPQAGVRAMILYPMNALANDQLKRLRTLLAGTNITFGRYTGDTPEPPDEAKRNWYSENPGEELLPNELISRRQIRSTPPNILLTNYSMLEYLLLRPEDAALFAGTFGKSWRHIAIDEAHVYSGALGTEIAYLLRRLKARIKSDSGKSPTLHCYATSATIGSPEDMPKVAKFAQDLFGEPFECGEGAPSVIKSEQDSPLDDLRDAPWGSLPLNAWTALRGSFASDPSGSGVREIIANSIPAIELRRFDAAPTVKLGLGAVLLGERSTATLVTTTADDLIDLTDSSAIDALGIEGLRGDDAGAETLAAMVEVLSSAQRSEDVPLLASRYHSFLKAPEGLYINLWKKELIADKTTGIVDEVGNLTPIYEVSVCRHCGEAYILGSEKREAGYAWLDPKHEGTNADDDFLPRDYYRITTGKLEDVVDDGSGYDGDGTIEWLCPICGTLHNTNQGGPHRFDHEPIERIPLDHGANTNEEESQCRHCNYRNLHAIQPMRVSPEAAGSVVCYELTREVPPFERNSTEEDDLFAGLGKTAEQDRPGSVICFSDKRQDAAFFAPAMERTYDQITVRQMIREAVDEVYRAYGECAPSDVVRWLADIGMQRHPVYNQDTATKAARDNLAWAWVLDELTAEDSRNSLEGLGVVRVEPTLILNLLGGEFSVPVTKTIGRLGSSFSPWLTNDDYVTLVRMCLDTLRERGGITVPEGAASSRRNRNSAKQIIKGDEDGGNSKKYIRFIGSTRGTENKRSAIIRRYAAVVHGKDLTREDSRELLLNIYTFLMQLFRKIESYKRVALIDGADPSASFSLNPDVWRFIPHTDKDPVYVCDKCGREYHYDTHGICLGNNCNGRTVKTTYGEMLHKDQYYKDIYQQPALPLRIEEHTAQLSSEQARKIQGDFIEGNVHVLSCTTTFELGVDVGDLRAVFLRNVPPSTANYTQRAGRTGRRAGMPGYAVTFARLRPHDIAFFRKPEKIIKGQTRPPMCYLDNDVIALRHVFAVALSQYFRDRYAGDGVNLTRQFDKFLNIGEEVPQGLEELREYLDRWPQKIDEQLEDVFSTSQAAAQRIGISEWNWVHELVDAESGRLTKAHLSKHTDYERLTRGITEADRNSNLDLKHSLENSREGLRKEMTINVLAESGVLPKYGFPTDLVELRVAAGRNSYARQGSLDLQRGLRIAIREYAPGAEIVAGKRLWKSTGIRKLKGRELETRKYGECPKCRNFVWAIDSGDDEIECPICKTKTKFNRRMLVPANGFTGEESSKGVGEQRPRTTGWTRVYFSQRWPKECETYTHQLEGGSVKTKYASNAQLCIINEGIQRSGFKVCMSCGAASSGELAHRGYCKSRIASRLDSLGTSFISDVLELSIWLSSNFSPKEDDWLSLLWALHASASQVLEIPESEIGGTLYFDEMGNASIMLYDDVPGGAGHAYQLSGLVEPLLQEAYRIVSTCTCDENTSCYGCLCNYYNQPVQYRLSRGSAMRVLGELLGIKE